MINFQFIRVCNDNPNKKRSYIHINICIESIIKFIIIIIWDCIVNILFGLSFALANISACIFTMNSKRVCEDSYLNVLPITFLNFCFQFIHIKMSV